MSELSFRLIRVRKLLNLSQFDIAERFRISRSAYSAWELSRNEPPLDFLTRFCDAFSISLDSLLGSDSVLPTVFSKRLQSLIDSNEKSFQDFFDFLGIDKRISILFLSGSFVPNFKTIKQICEYYKCSSDYLLGLSSIPDPAKIEDIDPNYTRCFAEVREIMTPHIPFNPLSDLHPSYKAQAESYIDFLRQQQAAELVETKTDVK